MRAADAARDDTQQVTPQRRVRVKVGSAAKLVVITSRNKTNAKVEPLSVTSVNEADEMEEAGKRSPR